MAQFHDFTINHIYMEYNKEADLLSKEDGLLLWEEYNEGAQVEKGSAHFFDTEEVLA